MHDLGGMGFTWYGGLIGGVVAALVIVRRHQLPLGVVAGAAAIPLTLAYGIGRLGCLLSGDGTYGKPTSVPWAMTFPNGVVPTNVPVHPTPLYEALAAVAIATVLWALGKRWTPPAVFGAYLALSGISRFLVEFLRINEPALLGLTQPQLWALAGLITGVVLIGRHPSAETCAPRGGRGARRRRSSERTLDRWTGVKLQHFFIIPTPNGLGSAPTLKVIGIRPIHCALGLLAVSHICLATQPPPRSDPDQPQKGPRK